MPEERIGVEISGRDNLSPQLQKLAASFRQTENQFRSFVRAMPTDRLKELAQVTGTTEKELRDLATAEQQLAQKTAYFGGAVQGATDKMAGLKQVAIAAGATLLAHFGADRMRQLSQGFLMAAGEMQTMRATLDITMGSAEKARKRMDELYTFAATTPFELKDLIQANQLMESFRLGGGNAIKMLRTFGDVAAGLKGAGVTLNEVVIGYGKLVGQMYETEQMTRLGISKKALEEVGIAFKRNGEIAQESRAHLAEAALEIWGRFAGGMKRMEGTYTQSASNVAEKSWWLKAQIGESMMGAELPLLRFEAKVLGVLGKQSPSALAVVGFGTQIGGLAATVGQFVVPIVMVASMNRMTAAMEGGTVAAAGLLSGLNLLKALGPIAIGVSLYLIMEPQFKRAFDQLDKAGLLPPGLSLLGGKAQEKKSEEAWNWLDRRMRGLPGEPGRAARPAGGRPSATRTLLGFREFGPPTGFGAGAAKEGGAKAGMDALTGGSKARAAAANKLGEAFAKEAAEYHGVLFGKNQCAAAVSRLLTEAGVPISEAGVPGLRSRLLGLGARPVAAGTPGAVVIQPSPSAPSGLHAGLVGPSGQMYSVSSRQGYRWEPTPAGKGAQFLMLPESAKRQAALNKDVAAEADKVRKQEDQAAKEMAAHLQRYGEVLRDLHRAAADPLTQQLMDLHDAARRWKQQGLPVGAQRAAYGARITEIQEGAPAVPVGLHVYNLAVVMAQRASALATKSVLSMPAGAGQVFELADLGGLAPKPMIGMVEAERMQGLHEADIARKFFADEEQRHAREQAEALNLAAEAQRRYTEELQQFTQALLGGPKGLANWLKDLAYRYVGQTTQGALSGIPALAGLFGPMIGRGTNPNDPKTPAGAVKAGDVAAAKELERRGGGIPGVTGAGLSMRTQRIMAGANVAASLSGNPQIQSAIGLGSLGFALGGPAGGFAGMVIGWFMGKGSDKSAADRARSWASSPEQFEIESYLYAMSKQPRYSYRSGSGGLLVSSTIGTVNVNVVSSDPAAAGQNVVVELQRLMVAGPTFSGDLD